MTRACRRHGSHAGLCIAGRRPQVDPTLDGEAIDLRELGGLEGEMVECREIVVELGDRTRADER